MADDSEGGGLDVGGCGQVSSWAAGQVGRWADGQVSRWAGGAGGMWGEGEGHVGVCGQNIALPDMPWSSRYALGGRSGTPWQIWECDSRLYSVHDFALRNQCRPQSQRFRPDFSRSDNVDLVALIATVRSMLRNFDL